MMRTSTNVCHLLMSCALALVTIVNLNAATAYPLEVMVKIPEGSACDLNQDDYSGAGTCVLVKECPPVIKSLKARRSHDFTRCGFRGPLEIVCCPDEVIQTADGKEDKDNVRTTSPPTDTGNTTSKAEVRGPGLRKSVQVCEDLVDRFDVLKVSTQISGGVNAEPGEFPHMAALGYETIGGPIEYRCGATLISERYVLTAAHCIVSLGAAPPVRVRMGMTDITGTDGEEVGVANITIHLEYNRKRSRRNDIALIELERAVTFTANLHAACLYTKPDDPKGLVITGWGLLETAGNNSDILQKGLVMPVEVSKCNSSYMQAPRGINIYQEQLCAISANGVTDACQGDSGGPIQAVGPASNVYYVVGVTSFGRGCGGTYPGVYTRVNSYLDWVEKIVWPK